MSGKALAARGRKAQKIVKHQVLERLGRLEFAPQVLCVTLEFLNSLKTVSRPPRCVSPVGSLEHRNHTTRGPPRRDGCTTID